MWLEFSPHSEPIDPGADLVSADAIRIQAAEASLEAQEALLAEAEAVQADASVGLIDPPVDPRFSSTINRAEIYVRSDLDADTSKKGLRSFGRTRIRTLAHELFACARARAC